MQRVEDNFSTLLVIIDQKTSSFDPTINQNGGEAYCENCDTRLIIPLSSLEEEFYDRMVITPVRVGSRRFRILRTVNREMHCILACINCGKDLDLHVKASCHYVVCYTEVEYSSTTNKKN
jgi:hypothetical protein